MNLIIFGAETSIRAWCFVRARLQYRTGLLRADVALLFCLAAQPLTRSFPSFPLVPFSYNYRRIIDSRSAETIERAGRRNKPVKIDLIVPAS
jgi:hypothetical protein